MAESVRKRHLPAPAPLGSLCTGTGWGWEVASLLPAPLGERGLSFHGGKACVFVSPATLGWGCGFVFVFVPRGQGVLRSLLLGEACVRPLFSGSRRQAVLAKGTGLFTHSRQRVCLSGFLSSWGCLRSTLRVSQGGGPALWCAHWAPSTSSAWHAAGRCSLLTQHSAPWPSCHPQSHAWAVPAPESDLKSDLQWQGQGQQDAKGSQGCGEDAWSRSPGVRCSGRERGAGGRSQGLSPRAQGPQASYASCCWGLWDVPPAVRMSPAV